MDGYEMQVLLAVAKGCKPNSPYPERAWLRVKPLWGTPEFGNALSALVRKGLLQRKHGYRVKPTPEGYAVVYRIKAQRKAMRERPVLFTRRVWDADLSV
jgi:hypothetical protein